MSVLRTLVAKSGGSVAKNLCKTAALGCIPLAFTLQGCSISNPIPKLPNMDLPFEKANASAYSAVDRRSWRINDASHFSGVVVADEPQAAQAAREILERGGNAADAAAGLYFALSVTYSGAAGLGGGGSCLYTEPGMGGVKQIDFPAMLPSSGGKVGVPGSIRGFAYLNVTHGRLAWNKVVEPATHLAGGEAVMSRATQAQLLAAKGRRPMPDGVTKDGKPISVGRHYSQPGLAATLGLIKGGGAGAFYNGDLADIFVSDSAKHGGTITEADLRGYKVSVSAANRKEVGKLRLFTRNTSDGSGQTWEGVDASSAKAAGSLSDAGSTSFVVADKDGRAAACVVSLGNLFGTGDVSLSSGIYYPDMANDAPLSSSVIMKTTGVGVTYVASASGASGVAKSKAIVSEVPMTNNPWLATSLRTIQGSGFDAVNVIYCREGISEDPTSCRFGTEPDGYGYGLMGR